MKEKFFITGDHLYSSEAGKAESSVTHHQSYEEDTQEKKAKTPQSNGKTFLMNFNVANKRTG